MYSDPSAPPTTKQKKSQDALVAAATKVLKKALEDAIEYGEDEPLDMEELQKDIDANLQEFARLQDEEEARLEEEGEVKTTTEDTKVTDEAMDAGAAGMEIDINSLPLAELADDNGRLTPLDSHEAHL